MVVCGGGPAAALLARALVGRGASVTVVAPGGLRPTPNTLCGFVDDIPPAFRAEVFSCSAVVDGQRLALPDYARVDGAAVVADVGAGVVDGVVAGVDEDGVVLKDGSVIGAGAVVDCSGGALRGQRARCFQSAVGVVVEGASDVEPGTAVFMDWSDDGVDSGEVFEGEAAPPSFLYLLAGRDGRVLVEETVLASRPAIARDVVARRLQRRLRARGWHTLQVRGREDVSIPLDVPLPLGAPAAFGVAAGLVHPTTGFSFGAAVRVVDDVAAAVVAVVGAGADAVAAAVSGALWTSEARRVRALQRFALESTLRLDRRAASSLFLSVLRAPGGLDFVRGTGTAAQTASLLLRVFGDAPWSLRRHLVRGLSPGALLTEGRSL